MTRRILIVGAGSDLQPRLRAMADDVQTVVMCRSSVLPWVLEPQDNQALLAFTEGTPVERWVSAARYLNDEWSFDKLVSFADLDQEKAAAIAEDLKLPFHSPDTVNWTRDKAAMRERLRALGIEDLPYRRVDSAAELAQFLAEVGPPLVVKPTAGRASTGIAVVRSADDVEAAFRTTTTATGPRYEPSPPLAERYVTGREYSVEAITHQGVHYIFGVVEKFVHGPSKVEIGHVVPARIDADEEKSLVEHVRRVLDALDVGFGITHTEVILGESGPVLVETHLRQAGDDIPLLIKDATGVDMLDLVLRQYLDEDLAKRPEVADRRTGPRYTAAAAIRYLVPTWSGVLDTIDGWSAAREAPGVRAGVQSVPDGSEVAELTSSFSRLGYVRTCGPDATTALARAEEALSMLTPRRRPA